MSVSSSPKSEVDYCLDIAERVRYEDGALFWVKTCQLRNIGKVVGRPDKDGYMRIHPVKGRMIACHRLIYFMFHGWLPEIVDHADGNPRNNRIENLRAADACKNTQNCKTPATNTSGVKGVYFHAGIGKWTASIRVNKRLTHLGTFVSILDAACARKSAEIKHYGEFAR
tara:strand:- start:1220 stop:1726 length:507 start_codon:yes stop_codon:yes gene_type:complete